LSELGLTLIVQVGHLELPRLSSPFFVVHRTLDQANRRVNPPLIQLGDWIGSTKE